MMFTTRPSVGRRCSLSWMSSLLGRPGQSPEPAPPTVPGFVVPGAGTCSTLAVLVRRSPRVGTEEATGHRIGGDLVPAPPRVRRRRARRARPGHGRDDGDV